MNIPTLEEKLRALKVAPPTRNELECLAQVRHGNYEIGVRRTDDILDEGHEVFVRSSRSSMGVAGDSIVGLFSAQGDLVNASAGTYLHSIIPVLVIKYVLKHFARNPGICDGDVWLANDALYGGIHNPDVMVLMPVFFGGELVAWTAALSHTTETGACEPGGIPLTAKSRFDEGMNLPPIKVGENFELRNDFVELVAAFGIRAEQMVTVDLKARSTAADRVRTRLIEMCEREGVEFVTGLFRRMLMDAEAGARRRLRCWPDGSYRCVTFGDAVGPKPGLVRNCYLTMVKQGDRLVFDFTGTGPETMSSDNAHAQAAIGHIANFIYEYVFHDLPISNGTFQPIDFVFPPGICLNASERAATSNVIRITSGLMTAMHNCVGRAMFPTHQWRQVQASNSNVTNVYVLSGISQWRMPFADIIAYSLNTCGQGGRSTADGMNAYGFPRCAFGRAPDVESMENELPLLVPFSQHWPDSGGHGKFRGGTGTAQFWSAHHVPEVYFLSASGESLVQTPQPLFGGYAPPTRPGLLLRSLDSGEFLRGNGNRKLDLLSLLNGDLGGELVAEFYSRPVRGYSRSRAIAVNLSVGGAGYGDPLDRDPIAVQQDLIDGLVSEWTATHVYKVAYDPAKQRVDVEKTAKLRDRERQSRIKRGAPLHEFEARWLKQKPPEEILEFYGSWPNAAGQGALYRP